MELTLDDMVVAVCRNCSMPIDLYTETVRLGDPGQSVGEEMRSPGSASSTERLMFEDGESVLFDNEGHPWHHEIAIICGYKSGFYRLEIRGSKIWVPQEWVRGYGRDDGTTDGDWR